MTTEIIKEKNNATCQIDASDFKRLLEQHQKADPSGVPILDMSASTRQKANLGAYRA